jgi:hypothetical protein
MGVFPPLLTSISERAAQYLPAHPQEWTVIGTIGLGHSFEASGATAPGKAEHHRLCLIVLGVSKEQPQRSGFLERFAKGLVTGSSGCVLWAFTAANLHNLGQYWGESPTFGAAGSSCGNVGGIRLKLVINDDGANLKAQFRELESRSPRKSQRISAATQGDEVETL